MSEQPAPVTNDHIPPRVRFVIFMERLFTRWLAVWLVIFGLFNLLPLLAPAAMQVGLRPVADAIYSGYNTISHQLAHRSYFFFGEKLMYTPEELPVTLLGEYLPDSFALSEYRGDADFGYKVAWSDRLVMWFGTMWVTVIFYALLHRRPGFKPLPRIAMILLVLPLILDGVTHYISDFDGLTAGFRWDNAWLATLTGNAFAESFYVGDDLGSFNNWTRLITGWLAGVGFMAWGLGRAEPYFAKNAATLRERLERWFAKNMSYPYRSES